MELVFEQLTLTQHQGNPETWGKKKIQCESCTVA